MKPMRHVFASRETAIVAKRSKNGRVQIYSFFPIDRAVCECQKLAKEFKKELSRLNTNQQKSLMQERQYLECPRDKTGMHRYVISCRNCKEVLGYCWATDPTLKDWCDFHYMQWSDGQEWYGCLTPHISPITEELCLECCCGQDTRDFRANMTLSAETAMEIENRNKIGREFGYANSKFLVRKVSIGVIPFKKG